MVLKQKKKGQILSARLICSGKQIENFGGRQTLFDMFDIFKSPTARMQIPFGGSNMLPEFDDQIFHTSVVGFSYFRH